MTTSPDGTTTVPGNGAALTFDSVPVVDGAGNSWKFAPAGPGAAGTPGLVMMNGALLKSKWMGYQLEVDSGGELYLQGMTHWWVWQNGNFVTSAPPPPPPTLTLAFTNVTQVPSNSLKGTHLATVVVTMSDQSTFNGTITTNDTTGLVAVSGLDLVTGRALTPTDIGTHIITVTATTPAGLMATAEMRM